MFIVFEGIDGSGKTTQAAMLANKLRNDGVNVLEIAFPTQTAYAMINAMGGRDAITTRAHALIQAADKAQLSELVIESALKDGMTVICDRYTSSTVAYQSGGDMLHYDHIDIINRFSVEWVTPDLEFLVDVPINVALDRIHSRGNGELVDEVYLSRVKNEYNNVYDKSPKMVIVHGTGEKERISEDIYNIYCDHRDAR